MVKYFMAAPSGSLNAKGKKEGKGKNHSRA